MKTPVAKPTRAPFRDYLMGYVAGIIYHDGRQWLLNKAGGWADERHDAPKAHATHIWPTFEEAWKIARAQHTAKFPAFVRPYVYSTPNPENARGMLPISEARETLYIQ